ncbi:hypothetical protein [Deinococcus budaensis]|uniref:Uncharacterized protein n=1 Tax=Deinococcus budaensis TaxID=1665626 RepID=A0A7W8GG94_9DEIO|nr:hypothetical protein [Deinococcus budaensis]MBB5234794.1 hypothetical protein [Deinococcus budaensis]
MPGDVPRSGNVDRIGGEVERTWGAAGVPVDSPGAGEAPAQPGPEAA